MSAFEPITNPIVLPVRRTRYLSGGVAKRGGVPGNGDSGKRQRHKITKQERARLAPQSPRDLLYRSTGQRVMRNVP